MQCVARIQFDSLFNFFKLLDPFVIVLRDGRIVDGTLPTESAESLLADVPNQ